MKACGITAEFNPLHKGHEYIMAEARRITGCDALVIAMSGDYVQRGEPAIVDKWARCRSALSSGADLVIEIPTVCCLGNAGQYARSGVTLLESLGCTDHICCGSETGDDVMLGQLASLIKNCRDSIESEINAMIQSGISYPAAREKAVFEIMKRGGASDEEQKCAENILGSPNDILALEYMMAAGKASVITVKRKGADYSDDYTDGEDFQSASAVRNLLRDGSSDALEKAYAALSEDGIEAVQSSKLTFPEEWSEVLRYAIMQAGSDDIDECPSGGEGLGNLLKEAALCHDSFGDIVMAAKSKRYTYTRISRLCMQVVLGIRRTEYVQDSPGYVRVLGFTEKGREMLADIKKNGRACLPVITNINKESSLLGEEAYKSLLLDIRASDVYNLVTGRGIRDNSDRVKGPIIIK